MASNALIVSRDSKPKAFLDVHPSGVVLIRLNGLSPIYAKRHEGIHGFSEVTYALKHDGKDSALI